MFFTVVTLCSEFSFKNYYYLILSFNSLVREDYFDLMYT